MTICRREMWFTRWGIYIHLSIIYAFFFSEINKLPEWETSPALPLPYNTSKSCWQFKTKVGAQIKIQETDNTGHVLQEAFSRDWGFEVWKIAPWLGLVNELALEIIWDKKCYPLTTAFFKTKNLITLNTQMRIKNSTKTTYYFTNVQSTAYCLYRYLI